jgi:hypothetical protein
MVIRLENEKEEKLKIKKSCHFLGHRLPVIEKRGSFLLTAHSTALAFGDSGGRWRGAQ